MDILSNQIIFLTLLSFTSAAIVKWLPNASFNLPDNFKDGKLPCSKKTVVFPESILGSVDLESVMDIGALILPDDGEIVLENAVISLGDDTQDSNCTNGNSYYLDKSISSWTQAGVWSSSRFNEATPDSERIPCYDDTVVFPPHTKYSVRLPDTRQTVRELTLDNRTFTSDSFISHIQTESDNMGQFVLNSFLQTGVTIKRMNCQNRFGCPCQSNPAQIDCSVKYCPQPTCVDPIKPLGYCCSFCGGNLAFDIDDRFEMIAFKELVEKIVDGYGNSIVYHIGFVPVLPLRKIQLVIIDKGEYSGNSLEAISAVNKNMQSHWYTGTVLSQISGGPLSMRYLGAKLFVSTFFAVIIVMGIIYFYYYRLPTTFPLRWPTRSGEHLFRFQTRSESVVSLTRRDSGVMPTPRTAFRNPLYDSKRERVLVAETEFDEAVEDS